VHHIDYNKNNNILFNLITLCKICHSKTNGHRNSWKFYLSGLMFEKFKNEYFDREDVFIPVTKLKGGQIE
jgi:hypothetical protein